MKSQPNASYLPTLENLTWMQKGPISRHPESSGPSSLPLVSVITPSFNQAPFIEATILSVLKQDYPSVELIVIDGGSTDGTQALLQRYSPWLAYWVSEPDRGQTHAINKGLDQSRGTILTYLNSDDIYSHAGVIRAIVERFAANDALDLVYGDICIIDESTTPIRRSGHPGFDRKRLENDPSYFIPQQATFWTKAAMARVGAFDEQFHYKMDREFYLRAAHPGKVEFINEIMAGFRTHRLAKSNPWNAWNTAREFKSIQRKHGLSSSFRAEAWTIMNLGYGLLPEALRHIFRRYRHRSRLIRSGAK